MLFGNWVSLSHAMTSHPKKGPSSYRASAHFISASELLWPPYPLLSIFTILFKSKLMLCPHLYHFFHLIQLLWPHFYPFQSNFVKFYQFYPILSNWKCTFLFLQAHCCGPSWWACQMLGPCVPSSDKLRKSAHALSDKHSLCWSLKHVKHFSPLQTAFQSNHFCRENA